MQAPYFYTEHLNTISNEYLLSEEASRHIVQVLRMKEGEAINLTDGKGKIARAVILDAHKKKTGVNILSLNEVQVPNKQNSIAVSLIKNANRFEWFLEKAAELGVSEIIPLICHRTEKQHVKTGRMQSILVSAMLQSGQAWLTHLTDPVKFTDLVKETQKSQKFIAHCEEDKQKHPLTDLKTHRDSIILIGPEGDFTKEEVELAKANQFIPLTLGDTRLRTETAAVAAAVAMQLF